MFGSYWPTTIKAVEEDDLDTDEADNRPSDAVSMNSVMFRCF